LTKDFSFGSLLVIFNKRIKEKIMENMKVLSFGAICPKCQAVVGE